MAAAKKSQEEKAPNQIVFVTEEIKSAVDFLNLVSSKATFTMSPNEMQNYIKLHSSLIKLIKKCEAHIFEITEHEKATK